MGRTISIRYLLLLLFALARPTAGLAADTTALYLDSQPGDFIGLGQKKTFTTVDATFSIQTDFQNRVRIQLTGPSYLFSWSLYFRATSSALLAPGDYFAARRAPFAGANELTVTGEARGCNVLTGRFTIREAVYAGTQVERFAADFEQHCDDNTPALFGAIRYNSTISSLVPFGGKYPSVRLAIAPRPDGGRVTGAGIDCGGAHADCAVNPAVGAFALRSLPDPGFVFAGWGQDCSGSASATVNVNSEKVCSAAFVPFNPDAPRSLAVFNGSPDDPVTLGQMRYLSPANSRWTLQPFALSYHHLAIRYNGPKDEVLWSVVFGPPTGESFQPGREYSISRAPGPGVALFDISADSRGCASAAGTLLVREWVPGPGSEPARFLFDFEFRCASFPPMAGVIQYQSDTTVPILRTARSTLAFGVTRNGSTIVAHSPDQVVQIAQTGSGLVSWQLKSDQPWLTATPVAGAGPGAIAIKIRKDAPAPAVARAIGHIYVVTRGAIEVPEPITVTANMIEASTTGPPFGTIDSPGENTSGVAGSIAITGWALDDLGIADLRLYRAPLPGEGTQLVFIGSPVRVEGARPDLAAAYPQLPLNTTAGWGYMLLTNMLPNGGNGPFTFYVYADDMDGHTALLGTRTIVTTNASSANPFGAIDTPGQGAVVSGLVHNFGWVLSPGTRRADPAGGGTVRVFIDGTEVGSPVGWASRPDLVALFPVPLYAGVHFALGVFTFDSTALADGTHTIAWGVADNEGGAAGVGSRYFTVFNGNSATSPVVAPARVSASIIGIHASGPVQGRTGFLSSTAYRDFFPNADGTIIVEARELDRIELRMFGHAGRLLTASGDEPLPIGAALDSDGTFTWQPGLAYIGTYRFVFDTAEGPRRVNIVLNPRRR